MQKEIIKEPKKTVYNIKFANLTDLYDYLKQNPTINRRIFDQQASLSDRVDFYGEPLSKAIEYCISGYKKGFDNFLILNDKLQATAHDEQTNNLVLRRTMYGGMPLSALVAAGVPDCMLVYERDTKSKVRNIYFNLCYPNRTKTEQIINRGLATLYLIQALESKGEMINFKAFHAAQYEPNPRFPEHEIVNIELNLKKPGDLFLDVEKCFFPISGKEFLRRVLFRVIESIDVNNPVWGTGYGSALNEEAIRDFYNVSPTDIVISHPLEMGITGKNLYDDTLALIEHLGLEKEFNIPKIKELRYKESIKKD